jgi:hypothetical protein
MDFTHDKSWEIFEMILEKRLSLQDSWKQLINFHEKIKAKKYWTELLSYNFMQEQQEVTEWLNELAVKDPIPSSVNALWIGIAHLYDDKENKEFYAYYIQGADNYDEDDIEWATEPTYDPDEKYFVPDILNSINALIKKDKKDFSFLDWILPIAYSSFLFDNILRNELNKSKFLTSQTQLHVSLGYDGGDFKELTPIKYE